MSNHVAVAHVTAALGGLIQESLDVDLAGAKVSYERPDSAGEAAGKKGVNVYLYQVTPNAELRNLDLPMRSASHGGVVTRPCVALDLHYLLTFYGAEKELEPERAMGSAVRALHENAVLPQAMVAKALTEKAAQLAGSDLGDAVEAVKFTPTTLNLEELSKLWSVLFQTPYKLSLAYRATVVLIESRERTGSALPVRSVGGYVTPFSRTEITSIEASGGALAPITWGGTMVLRGHALVGDTLIYEIDGQAVAVDTDAATDDAVPVELVAATFGGAELPAGVHTARTRKPLGGDAPAHLAQVSGAHPFLLRPVLSVAADAFTAPVAPATAGTLAVGFVPDVVAGQDVELLLDLVGADVPTRHTFSPRETDAADFPASELTFDVELPGGTYLVRAVVDDAESPLDVDEDATSPTWGQVTGPTVVLP